MFITLKWIRGLVSNGNCGAASFGSQKKFGFSTELITKGKLAIVKRFEC